MSIFRAFLAFAIVLIFVYTTIVIARHGIWFLPPYIFAVQSLTWAGQFSVDFSIYLAVSACWVAWRNGFTQRGNCIAVAALILGAVVFLPYLLWLSLRSNGDVKQLILGVHHRGA